MRFEKATLEDIGKIFDIIQKYIKKFIIVILEILFYFLYAIGFVIQIPFYVWSVRDFSRIFSDFKEISRETIIIIKESFTF